MKLVFYTKIKERNQYVIVHMDHVCVYLKSFLILILKIFIFII